MSSIIITYWNMPRSDDEAMTPRQTYYYGKGRGIISSIEDSSETARVTEYGVGKSLGQKNSLERFSILQNIIKR
jgi:hypothetical protein